MATIRRAQNNGADIFRLPEWKEHTFYPAGALVSYSFQNGSIHRIFSSKKNVEAWVNVKPHLDVSEAYWFELFTGEGDSDEIDSQTMKQLFATEVVRTTATGVNSYLMEDFTVNTGLIPNGYDLTVIYDGRVLTMNDEYTLSVNSEGMYIVTLIGTVAAVGGTGVDYLSGKQLVIKRR